MELDKRYLKPNASMTAPGAGPGVQQQQHEVWEL
jgi:hypothetical protein